MKIVEIFGLSGAGKTSIINLVINKSPNIHSMDRVLSNSILPSFRKFENVSLNSVERFHIFICKNFLLKNKFTKKIGCSLLLNSPYINNYFFVNYMLNAPHFHRFVKDKLFQKNSEFLSAYFGYMNAVVKIYVASELTDNKLVLVDEGPIKYMQSLLRYTSDCQIKKDIINELLDCIQFTSGGIFITVRDHSMLPQRLNQRKGGAPFNLKYKSSEDLKNAFMEEESNIKIIRECMRSRGSLTLDLRANDSIQVNVERTSKFMMMVGGL